MTNEELKVHLETLEEHVARLEGIIHVMLEELESGTIQESAARIRTLMKQTE